MHLVASGRASSGVPHWAEGGSGGVSPLARVLLLFTGLLFGSSSGSLCTAVWMLLSTGGFFARFLVGLITWLPLLSFSSY